MLLATQSARAHLALLQEAGVGAGCPVGTHLCKVGLGSGPGPAAGADRPGAPWLPFPLTSSPTLLQPGLGPLLTLWAHCRLQVLALAPPPAQLTLPCPWAQQANLRIHPP